MNEILVLPTLAMMAILAGWVFPVINGMLVKGNASLTASNVLSDFSSLEPFCRPV